ncbi:glycosyltransferase [Ruania alba]|uniref:D-inositol 3-phosphate glycosyltransferase n=1 Tax=Ruania alba TaxID=648782 RepID=A0A1H5F8J3_9MICO|nr:glycosyltransferase [Ruania alba]SED99701.1 D-inositol-3-phosphate glycosyltransferase [Ruania alba]
MPLRVAMVSLHTSPGADPGAGDVGGMNVVIRHLAGELAALGCEIDILTRRTDPAAPTVVELAAGVRLRHLDAGPAQVRPKSEHEAYIHEFGDAMSTCGGYDLIHAHHWFSGLAALDVARAWGTGMVQSFHSIAAAPESALAEGERPESPGRMVGEARLAREANALLAVSSAERRTIVDRLGAAPDRVTVVRPGVDVTQFHPAGERESGAGYLLAAARLEPLKGIDLAIEAVAGLDPQVAPELVICGGATSGFEDYPDQLHQLVAARGLSGRVRFLGPCSRDELAALMRGARIFLNPSHSETYGLTALEAAASGVPVVAAESGGLVEAVRHGETGLLLHTRDPDAWTGALQALLTDPARVARLARGGRAHAEQHTWAQMAQRTLAVYQQLIGA